MNQRVKSVWIKYRGLCLNVLSKYYDDSLPVLPKIYVVFDTLANKLSHINKTNPKANTYDEMFLVYDFILVPSLGCFSH